MLTEQVTPQRAANVGFFRVHSKKFLPSYNIKPLSAYSPHEIKHKLDNYFAFMFVRDPLERLVSAFRDKMHSDDEALYKKIGRRIRRKFRRQG